MCGHWIPIAVPKSAAREIAGPLAAARATPPSRARELAHALRSAWLQVFGIPDYERYLAHRAAHHPGEPVLSRQCFAAQAIERKYGSGRGPRCC
jgi:uncharacterized short protein YbdD (DUF466 family)